MFIKCLCPSVKKVLAIFVHLERSLAGKSLIILHTLLLYLRRRADVGEIIEAVRQQFRRPNRGETAGRGISCRRIITTWGRKIGFPLSAEKEKRPFSVNTSLLLVVHTEGFYTNCSKNLHFESG